MMWPTAQLSQGIADVVRGVTFSQGDIIHESREGFLPVLRAGNIAERLETERDLVWVPDRFVSDRQRLRKNDIVMCTSSGSALVVGKTAIAEADFDGSWGAFNAVLRSTSAVVPKFLYYWFQSNGFKAWRDRQAKGANIQNIRHSELANLAMPFPAKSEQSRIVELLDEADRLRRLRREADAKAARILPALFLKMFGDPAANPMGWSIASFANTFDDTTAGNEKLQSSQFLKTGKIAVVDQGQSQIAGYSDDVSIAYRGKLPVIAFGDHTRIFKFIDHPFVLGADGVRVLTPKPKVNPLFAYWHCKLLNIPSAGYSRHFKYLKEKSFIHPDEALQNRFSELTKTAMSQTSVLEKGAAKVEQIFSVLLDNAFSGQLTAKWREAHMKELLVEMEQQARLLNLPSPIEQESLA